ncbi:unnamed protein product [Clavelina lepadiformis]|uniref:Uncharacterized protein n=1 Tax=Clavelina lepadiformis TaxID=159417 RepID=A0ABP0FH52_CLALP
MQELIIKRTRFLWTRADPEQDISIGSQKGPTPACNRRTADCIILMARWGRNRVLVAPCTRTRKKDKFEKA